MVCSRKATGSCFGSTHREYWPSSAVDHRRIFFEQVSAELVELRVPFVDLPVAAQQVHFESVVGVSFAVLVDALHRPEYLGDRPRKTPRHRPVVHAVLVVIRRQWQLLCVIARLVRSGHSGRCRGAGLPAAVDGTVPSNASLLQLHQYQRTAAASAMSFLARQGLEPLSRRFLRVAAAHQ